MSPQAREILHWGLFVERVWPDKEEVARIYTPPDRQMSAKEMGAYGRARADLMALRAALMPPDEEEVTDG